MPPTAPVSPSPQTTPARVRRPATILLIDDDPAVCTALLRLLKLEGWHVVTAPGGEQALERLQAHEPSLIITDLCMAKISGWDILFHEKLQRPALPIFVITALPRNATRDADSFATEFFQKPVDPDALIAAVCRHLGPPPAKAANPGDR
jgi:DNA-binding NtrC family response regulator